MRARLFSKIVKLLENDMPTDDMPTDDIPYDLLGSFESEEKRMIETGLYNKSEITIDKIKELVETYGMDWFINQVFMNWQSSLNYYRNTIPGFFDYLASLATKYNKMYIELLAHAKHIHERGYDVLDKLNFTIKDVEDLRQMNEQLFFHRILQEIIYKPEVKSWFISQVSSDPITWLSKLKQYRHLTVLPDDVLTEIFSKMDVKDIAKFAENVPFTCLPTYYKEYVLSVIPPLPEKRNAKIERVLAALKDRTKIHERSAILEKYGKPTYLKLSKKAQLFDRAVIAVPFSYAKNILSTTTLMNVARVAVAGGVQFDKIYIVDKSQGRNRLSYYITGKTKNGEPVTFARIETSNSAAGQTKVYTRDKVVPASKYP